MPLWQQLKEEPVMIGALLLAVVALVVSRFGFSAEEVGYILAGAAVVTGVGVRQRVMSVAKVERLREGPHL